MGRSSAIFLAFVAVLVATTAAIDTSEECICVPPTPCHYEGHCSELVGGYCSHGTELCDPVGGDTEAPSFVLGSPAVRDVIDKSFHLDVALSENGVFSWVLLENDSPAPNALEVILGTGANNAAPLQSGEVAVLIADHIYSDFMGGLTANTPYDLYVAANDNNGNPTPTATLVEVMTDIDRYPPQFVTGFPVATSITHNSFRFDVQLDETGTAHYAVMHSSAAPPSSNHIVDGTVAGDVYAAGSFDVTAIHTTTWDSISSIEFEPASEVSVFAVAVDALGNASPSPTRLDVMLDADVTAPEFVGGFPQVNTISDSSITVSVQLDEPGQFFAIIVPADTLEPSATSVRASALADAVGNVLSTGSEDVPLRFQTADLPLSGLSASTDYVIYVVAEDVYSNMGVVSSVEFRTLPDATAPEWSEDPAVWTENLRDTSLECVTSINEAGTVFIVVLPAGSAEPSPEEVRDDPNVYQASVLQGGTIFPVAISNLDPETTYAVYAVAADAAGNLQSEGVQHLEVTTLKAVAEITAGPTIEDVTETSATLNIELSEGDATVFVLVLPTGAAAPTAEEIHSGSVPGAILATSGDADVAGEMVSVPLTGLEIATVYDVWVVSINIDGLLLLQPESVSFISAGDVEFPMFVSGYPRFVDILDTNVGIEAKLDEAGTVSYVILPDGTAAPTVAAVHGRTAGGALAVGTITVEGANALATADGIGGLQALTDYDAYFVATDASNNLQPVPTLVEFRTTEDVTAPSPVAPGPHISQITQASAQVSAETDEDATMYCIAVPADQETEPSSAQVIAGGAGLGAVAESSVLLGSGEAGATALTGLTPLTAYDVWVVFEDDLGNMSPTPFHLDLETSADVGPPGFLNGFPRVVDIGETDAALEVKTDEPGGFFYVIVPNNHATPIATSVRDASGTNILAFGSGVLADPSTVGSSAFAGLEPDTEYDLYVVAQDSVANLQGEAHLVEFTTLPDATPPAIEAGYPLVTEVLDRSADFNVKSDEDATWHLVVLHPTSPQPTPAQVMDGTGQGGAEPVSYATVTSGAFAIVSVTVWNLTPETDYIVYAVAADEAGNAQPEVASLALTTAEDTFPPVFLLVYPDVTSITENFITLSVSANEVSVVHWLILPNGASPPTAEEIVAITDGTEGAVDSDFYNEASSEVEDGGGRRSSAVDAPSRVTLASGWVVLPELGVPVDIDIATGPLEAETAYDLYVVAIDKVRHATPPVKLDVTTVMDETPPINADGFPRLADVVDRSAVIEHQTNEHGRFFAVALEAGADAPTTADVVAGTGFNAAVSVSSTGARLTAFETSTGSLYNLEPLTTYDVYVVAEDWAGIFQPQPVLLTIETLADTHDPSFVPPTPEFAGATESFVSIRLVLNEPGTVLYTVYPAGTAPDGPSAADVVTGAPDDADVLESGSDLFGTAGADLFLRIPTDRLEDNEDYDVFIVIVDLAGRTSGRGYVLIRTIVDDTPPSFSVGYPSVSSVTARSADIDIMLSERAFVWYVVTPAGPAQTPTTQEVLAGTAAGGQAALIAGNAFVLDADSVTTFRLNYLHETTSYDAFVVAVDSKGNTRSMPSMLRFTTLPDFDPPVVSDVGLEDVTDSSWTWRVTVNEAGSFYWIVVNDGEDAPATDQILNGKTFLDEAPVDAGVFEISPQDAGSPFYFPVIVFTRPETQYDIYFVMVDRAADPNTGSVGFLEVLTTADVSSPRYLPGYPIIDGIQDVSAALVSLYSEDCDVHWVVTRAPFATQPIPAASAEEVKAGEISAEFVAGDGEDGEDGEGAAGAIPPTVVAAGTGRAVGRLITSIQLTGLFSLTRYVVYTVAEDGAGNLQPDSGVRILEFETSSGGLSAQAAQNVGLFGQGDTGAMDFTVLIVGVIVLLLLVLCCCVLGRRKKKYTHLEVDGKVTPDGDVVGWEGPDGDALSDGGSGSWAPVERASRDGWARQGSGSGIELSDVTGELDDEFVEGPMKKHAGAPGMNLEPLGGGAASGSFELNRTPVLGGGDAGARRSFVNREMMDLDMVLREAEDVSTSVMNRAPEMVENVDGVGELVATGGSQFSSSVYTEETSSEVVYSGEATTGTSGRGADGSGTFETSSSNATSSYK
mmetsp:Transcript_146273/g.354995  ORF Transcript_146273/g.354995 Transcript_146273/m.354995 type:complete len:2103 (-) Transcript_146273:69-6377(-)